MIKAPKWCSDAVPTIQGWVNPVTREVYKKQKISEQQIDEFFGNNVSTEATLLTEAPANNVAVEDMTEVQVEALEQQVEVETKPKGKKRKKWNLLK